MVSASFPDGVIRVIVWPGTEGVRVDVAGDSLCAGGGFISWAWMALAGR